MQETLDITRPGHLAAHTRKRSTLAGGILSKEKAEGFGHFQGSGLGFRAFRV